MYLTVLVPQAHIRAACIAGDHVFCEFNEGDVNDLLKIKLTTLLTRFGYVANENC